MKSLVTGGAGFIGSHVARYLIGMGHQVMILDDLSGGNELNVPSEARFEHGSILDCYLIERLFSTHRFDFVYHCAAYAAENLSHFIKRFNYENNLIGSINLINASVNYGVKCFVFTSSIAVYGALEPPFREDMVCKPEDSYGIAKLAVEQELRISHEMFGLDYVIFRPHNVYGPGQNIGDKYRNVIGIFMNQCLRGEPMTIFGDGEQSRAFSYISDVAGIIASSAQFTPLHNGVFNIGSNAPYTINDVAGMVAMALGSFGIKRLPDRKEVKIAFCDHAKLNSLMPPLTRPVNLPEGIPRMAAWAREHGTKAAKPFENIEIQKNLPEGWR